MTVDSDYGDRLDVYVSVALDMSRSQVKNLIDDGMVTVNGLCVKAGYKLKSGDQIAVGDRENSIPDHIAAEDIPLDVVYEDDDIAVVNKPRGMVVHPASGIYTGTLVNALLWRFQQLSEGGGAMRPGIVHRLDKDTSGLIVVAKNDRAHAALAVQIGEKTAHRDYIALLEGVVKTDNGEIVTQIGRDTRDRKKMAVVRPPDGKRASTHYDVMIRYEKHTLVHFRLGTGRTHQIRVHAKYLGHPVVGDPSYGYSKPSFTTGGQLLHAARLELTQPTNGRRLTFCALLPEIFTDTLKKLTPQQVMRPIETMLDNPTESVVISANAIRKQK